MTRTKLFCIFASIALYLCSLAFPAADRFLGFECLVAGWFSLGAGVGFGWLANPLIYATWLLLAIGKNVASLLVCLFAVILMLSTLAASGMVASTSGDVTQIKVFGPGFWLWVGSALVALVCAAQAQLRSQSRPVSGVA
jgi:hypothetical protein